MYPASIITLAIVLFIGIANAGEAENESAAQRRLAVAMKDANLVLTDAVRTGATVGTPIFAQFDLDEGKLGCFVVVKKDDTYIEVLLDPMGGKIISQGPVTESEDLAEMKKQSAALDKAKCKLVDVLLKTEAANPGYRIISILSGVGKSDEIAEIELLKDSEFKYVDQRL